MAVAAMYALLLPAAAQAQYTTHVGQAEPVRRLRATAVLEYTGSLEKPNASRLVPVAVWDGERFQPGGLYLAHPEPLALENGTEYELLRDGSPAGLWTVRGASEIGDDWVGMGRFRPEAPPPPVAKLKPMKKQPVIAGGTDGGAPTLHRKADAGGSPAGAQSGDSDAPTLHRRDGSAASPSGSSPTASGNGGSSGGSSGTGTAAGADPDAPTLHRRDGTAAGAGGSTASGSTSVSTTASDSTKTDSTKTDSTAASAPASGSDDPDRPTLHRRDSSTGDTGTTTADSDPDRPTLHKRSGTDGSASAAADPDRPTLHRSRAGAEDAPAAVDPDRPHLRYGRPAATDAVLAPVALEGHPAKMEQVVAVSDATPDEDPRAFTYRWPDPGDAAKLTASLRAVAAAAVASAAEGAPAGSKPARTSARPAVRSAAHAKAAPAVGSPALVGEELRAYELSFSAGPTLVYTAHTEGDGAGRSAMWVTVVAQPDFYGNPQVLLKQVARGDRLDQTPILKPVDAVDADGDGQAELLFELDGTRPGVNPVARQFALYRVAGGVAKLAFTSGPLP